jgi:hypothetical protein
MNPASLEDLKPLHLPDAVSIWPLAPGWWILISLPFVIAAIVMLIAWYKKRPKTLAYNALKSLAEKLSELSKDDPPSDTYLILLQELNQLLKSISLLLNPKGDTAKLSGQAWANHLGESEGIFTPEQLSLLSSGIYAPTEKIEIDKNILTNLLSSSQKWIRKYP